MRIFSAEYIPPSPKSSNLMHCTFLRGCLKSLLVLVKPGEHLSISIGIHCPQIWYMLSHFMWDLLQPYVIRKSQALERYQSGHVQKCWELHERRWDISKWCHSRSIYQVFTFLGILRIECSHKTFKGVCECSTIKSNKVSEGVPRTSNT